MTILQLIEALRLSGRRLPAGAPSPEVLVRDDRER